MGKRDQENEKVKIHVIGSSIKETGHIQHLKEKTWAARVAQRFSAAFSPGCDPGDLGSSPCQAPYEEPASPSACVSLSLSLCDYHK